MGKFQPHVAEPAEADDADLLPGFYAPLAQRRVGGDAGAEQGSDRREIEILGDAQGEILIDHNALGVAAKRHAALVVLVGAVVGEGKAGIAEVLEALLTARAGAAGIDHAADRSEIAFFKLGHLAADGGDAADDLVAGHAGVNGVVPLVAGLVDIRMADAAEEDLDLRHRSAEVRGDRCGRERVAQRRWRRRRL